MATSNSDEKKADLKVVGNKEIEEPKTDITAEELIKLNTGFQTQETKIGTLQGKVRQEIGKEWKDREVHPKAMSHMRTGMKIGDDRKRIHYFESVLAVAQDLLDKYKAETTEEMDFDDGKKAADG